MGLVVAEVATADDGLQALLWRPDIIIDGRSVGTVIGGLVVLALEPGAYVLESFRHKMFAGAGTTTFSGVSVTTQRVDTTTTPIHQSFTVSSGRITNLGLLYLARSDTGGVAAVRIENDEDMTHLLSAFYPELLRKLDPNFVRPARAVTADAEMLQRLRQREAVAASKNLDRPQCCVAGEFGAVAELVRDSSDRLTDLELLEAKSVSSVQSSDATHERMLFLTRSGRLFLVKGGRVEERRPPLDLESPMIAVGPEQNVVIVDHRRNAYVSRDDGMSWRAVAGSGLDTTEIYWVDAGAAGYYVHRYEGSELHFGSYDGSPLKQVELPDDLGAIDSVREVAGGLLVQTRFSRSLESSPRPFYFRDNQGTWERRRMPAANCNRLKFPNPEGNALHAACADRAPPVPEDRATWYTSTDSGKTWQAK